MIEFRYLRPRRTTTEQRRLQFRLMKVQLDGLGPIYPSPHWTDWQDIPVVIDELPKEQSK